MERICKNIQLTLCPSRVHYRSYTFYTSCTFLSITFLMICNIAFCAADNTFYSKCDNASDLRQQLELASELGSDLQVTMNWGQK